MIHTVHETGSTNADLIARLRAGDFVPEGDWLVADRQTAGRGRHGREWFDGAGNFMGSTVVHRRFGDPDPATLALVAGLAVHEAVAWHAPGDADLWLKWPNDLMAGKAKLAGILLEGQGDAIIVGIGVNLVFAPDVPDRETVALSDLGTAPDRDVYAADLAKSFDTELERWRNFGLGPIIRRWEEVAHPIGTQLRAVESGEAPVFGTYAGLDATGGLQLRLADGSMRAIHAGEVFLARDDK